MKPNGLPPRTAAPSVLTLQRRSPGSFAAPKMCTLLVVAIEGRRLHHQEPNHVAIVSRRRPLRHDFQPNGIGLGCTPI